MNVCIEFYRIGYFPGRVYREITEEAGESSLIRKKYISVWCAKNNKSNNNCLFLFYGRVRNVIIVMVHGCWLYLPDVVLDLSSCNKSTLKLYKKRKRRRKRKMKKKN